MDSMSLEEFKSTIEAAARTRSTSYSQTFCATIRWQADDTNAERDASIFKDMVKEALHLPDAIEFIIPPNHPAPHIWLQRRSLEIQELAYTAAGRSLVIYHYAGHGQQDSEGSLYFVENGRRGAACINASRRLFQDPCEFEMSDNMDCLFILDCCYSRIPSRAMETTPRTVELIANAATDEATSHSNTITNKLYRAIMYRKSQGQQYIEFAELMESLRGEAIAENQEVPTHFLKMGAASICIPFQGPRPSFTVDHGQLRPVHYAKFRAKVDSEFTKEEQEEFVQWLHNRPPSVPLELLESYPSGVQSTSLVFKGAWRTWSRLAGVKGYRLFDDLPVLGHKDIQPFTPR
ncbi:uncharacterized protein DSM5745_09775 [Aspergillus mulundensis]|uniref:Peptidase C14 caspase domain-containing protein n=1 Tax=Aspergillus mulundensis TaxID=1810919 RepID=A0A3D8QSA1_9EURO|nr:hypothetical protein DSM5745_09775 [Aspergillus mulundensis]RDW64364.1 hypothetical protein DSM5745_09775 [Aspergillus mulundensis]